jgi:YYY domain-containing protein
LKNLADPPLAPPSWSSPRHWWWWRSSRVVNDVNLAGVEIEVIDEFPFFSFLLADNHPHLLALPFVLLIVGFALQIYLAGKRGDFQLGQVALGQKARAGALTGGLVGLLILAIARAVSVSAEGLSNAELLLSIMTFILMGVLVLGVLAISILLIVGDLPSALPRPEFFFGAWLFGGLLFLNTWDYPIYLSMFLVVMWWSARSEPLIKSLKLVGSTAIGLTVAAVLLYLPWYPSFASQAGGVLPNLIFPTRLPQFLVMFATAFIPILTWLIDKVRRGWRAHEARWLLVLAIGLPLSLLLLSWVFSGGVKLVLERNEPSQLAAALQGMGAAMAQDVIAASVSRLYSSWTALTLGATIALGVILLKRNGAIQKPEREDEKPWPFVVMLIGIGALLVLGPEFFYLKDQFGSRMNTVFKFYFAAWILWGIAAAYATYELWPRRGSRRSFLFVGVILPLIMGLFYPTMATWTKTGQFNPAEGRTLDASAFVARRNADDYVAIQWINVNLPAGVITEAVGGSYSYFARVSTHTGLSTVLGWPGHESQWRGGYTEMGSRMDDIAVLYKEPNWSRTQEILDRYNIDYVYVGLLELTTYNPVFEIKFEDFMDVIYEVGDVRIYARRGKAQP